MGNGATENQSQRCLRRIVEILQKPQQPGGWKDAWIDYPCPEPEYQYICAKWRHETIGQQRKFGGDHQFKLNNSNLWIEKEYWSTGKGNATARHGPAGDIVPSNRHPSVSPSNSPATAQREGTRH